MREPPQKEVPPDRLKYKAAWYGNCPLTAGVPLIIRPPIKILLELKTFKKNCNYLPISLKGANFNDVVAGSAPGSNGRSKVGAAKADATNKKKNPSFIILMLFKLID